MPQQRQYQLVQEGDALAQDGWHDDPPPFRDDVSRDRYGRMPTQTLWTRYRNVTEWSEPNIREVQGGDIA